MNTFCCFSLERAKKTAIKFVKWGLLFGGLAFLAGCTNSLLTGGTAERRPEVVGKGDRARVLVSDLPQTVSMNQNGSETMVTLLYESPGGAVPASCYLDLDSRARIVETTSCACADGICRVGVRPQAGVYGEGSFAFHLVDTAKVVSDAGSVKVKILPVTISVFSGDGQKGIVGTELPLPLVVSVQNSEKAPVSGVKVSWKLGKGGRILCTTDESDYQGRVQCDWILGTEVDPGEISSTHGVEASIFVQGEGGDRKGTGGQGSHEPLPARFTATVKSGPVSQLAFSPKKYPESGLVAGENLGSVVIYPQDAYGNLTETSKDLVVVLSLDSKPDGGALSGGEPLGDDKKRTMPPKWRGGSFSEKALWLEKAGTYSLKASSPELEEAAIGKEFVVVPDKAKRLVFAQQPGGGAAGAVWDRQPRVLIQDTYGNGATEPLMVTVSTVENLEAKDFGGALSLKGDGGTVAFKDLKINKAGRYKLKASAPPLEVVESEFFIIDPASANQLVFTKQPSGGSAGVPWVQQPQVAVLDPFGNKVTSFSGDVMIAIRTSSGSSPVQVLKGKTTVKVDGGEASFAGLSFDLAGDYILTAMSSGLFWSDTKQFSVTPGPGVRLAFVGELKNGTAGVALAPSPQVIIEDDFGNMVTTSAAEVTLALGANPGQGILSGTTLGAIKVPAANGVASFAGLSINKSGVGYTLAASGEGLTGATSAPFNITAGAAAKLAFIMSPGGAGGVPEVAGKAFAQQPQVAIQDTFGNTVTDSSAEVTLAIGANPSLGTSGTLSGTATLAASRGVAAFSGLSINKSGTGYTLTASNSELTGATSSEFNITAGTATQLVFSAQPGGGIAGSSWAQQPVVTIQDASGNTITDSSAEVTLAIGTNPSPGTSGTLSGTATLAASRGVAAFSGLSINKSGTGYTLTASSTGLTVATSSEFNITAGTATQLVFSAQPGGGIAGSSWAQQPVVTIQDALGNTVTSSSMNVLLSLGTNPGSGNLSGTATLSASGGVATFSGLSINKSGTGYILTASSTGLTGTTSSGFNIAAGAATQLVFTTQPAGGSVGGPFATQPTVTIQDAYGNTVTNGADGGAPLTISLNSGTGTLSGTTTVTAALGVATWSGLSIDTIGSKVLRVNKPDLTGSGGAGTLTANSSSFSITSGGATKLAFTTQPGGGTADSAWGQQPVIAVQDSFGNTVTSVTASITLIIGTNPGTGALSGTATVNAINGIATFVGLSINKTGTGYSLTASSSGLTGATSSGFNITAGTATQLVFSAQPGGGIAGSSWAQQPVVTIQDASGNTVTDSSAEVTLAIGANPSQGILSGTTSGAIKAPAVNGVASFAGLSIEKSGTGYTLTASSTGLTGATSSTFNITHSNATQLVFTTQPGGAVAGVAFTTQPVVAIRDAYGNNITGGTDAGAGLTISLSSGTGSLSGTTIIMASLGISSWSGLSIDAFGSKTLQVNKPDLTGSGGTGPLSVTSNSFNNATNPPPIPTGLGANAGDNSVALSWTASSGATSYNILRGTSAGSLTQLATSNTNSYTDSTASNGTIYFYAVQSSSPRGTSGNSSNIQAEPLSTPSISSFAVNDTAGAGALVLSWSASAGASNYQVKYSTTSGSASSGIGGCTVTALTCTVTGLTSGTMYYFSVNATNTYSGSVNSSESSGIPRAVPTLSLTPGNKQITPVFASTGATSFNLSYGTSAGFYSTTVTGAASGTAITGLVNGTVYYFKVVANFSTGSLSSAEISTAPNGPQGFTITSATQGDTQVALVWGSSTGATSYTVKYGTSSNSYGSTFATGVTGTSSTVTGLTNGTTYYFMVTAVNASGSQDANAEFVRTPALPTLSTISSSAYDSANTQVVTSTLASNWSANLGFTLGGLSSFTCNGTVTASSSSTSIVPNSSLTLSGTYPNCTLNVAVTGGTTGSTTITLTATHGSATANRNFVFYILPQATLAYATRLVVLGYTGSALRVRDSTNSAQADVAFDSNGIVSANSTATVTSIGTSGYSVGQTMTFSSFYSTHSLYVVTWYDQSGRGADMTQATAGNQPRIVNAGVIESAGSAPAIRGIGSSQTYMKIATTSVTIGTINSVAQFFSSTPAWGGIYSFRASNSQHTPATTTKHFGAQNGSSYTIISNHLGSAIAVWVNGTAGDQKRFNNHNSGIPYTNNSILTQYLAGPTGNLNGTIFEDNCCGNRSLDGTIQEVIFFPAQLSEADRQALEHRQESTYGIAGI